MEPVYEIGTLSSIKKHIDAKELLVTSKYNHFTVAFDKSYYQRAFEIFVDSFYSMCMLTGKQISVIKVQDSYNISSCIYNT